MKKRFFKAKNVAFSASVGALGGALFTAVIFLGVWSSPFKNLDRAQALKPQGSVSSIQDQRYATTSSRVKSGLVLTSGATRVFEEILDIESDFDQTAVLYTLVADADEAFVLDLIDQAKTLPDSHQRDAALSIMFLKYADIDPVAALSKSQDFSRYKREKIIDRIYHQWSKNDLDAALESAKSLQSEQREIASESILNARADLSLDHLFALADELQNVEYRDKYTARIWRAQTLEDPRSAWNDAVLSIGDIKNRRLVLTTIAETWIEKEGLNALVEISTSDLRQYYKTQIYRKVLGEVAEKDIERAVNVAASLKLSPGRFGFSSSVVNELFSKWAEEAPFQLFGLADSLDPRYVAVAKHQALAAIARISPQEAVALFEQLNNTALEMHTSGTIATQWAITDPRSSLEWYMQGMRSEHDPSLRFIMGRLVEEDAHRAFKIVEDYEGELGALLTNSFFRALVDIDGVDATQFISLLDDDERQVPVTMIGRNLAGRDINQALALERNLPESGRKEYRTKIISAASFPDAFYLFENIDQLPSAELRSQAALQLLMRNKAEGVFSDKQLKDLRSRLDADGRQMEKSVIVTGSYSR